jgi:hypothetical protein
MAQTVVWSAGRLTRSLEIRLRRLSKRSRTFWRKNPVGPGMNLPGHSRADNFTIDLIKGDAPLQTRPTEPPPASQRRS